MIDELSAPEQFMMPILTKYNGRMICHCDQYCFRNASVIKMEMPKARVPIIVGICASK